MTTKKHISLDAFIRPAMDTLDVPMDDGQLFRRFAEQNADRIDVMWWSSWRRWPSSA